MVYSWLFFEFKIPDSRGVLMLGLIKRMSMALVAFECANLWGQASGPVPLGLMLALLAILIYAFLKINEKAGADSGSNEHYLAVITGGLVLLDVSVLFLAAPIFAWFVWGHVQAVLFGIIVLAAIYLMIHEIPFRQPESLYP